MTLANLTMMRDLSAACRRGLRVCTPAIALWMVALGGTAAGQSSEVRFLDGPERYRVSISVRTLDPPGPPTAPRISATAVSPEAGGPTPDAPPVAAASATAEPAPVATEPSPAAARPAATPLALPPPPAAPRQTPAWGLASQRADGHLRYAFDLARRGVVYSAQAEFIQAMKLVAQVLDTQAGNQEHSTALAAGLRALTEAEDFVPEDAHREPNLDLSRLISTHRTPVLQHADPQRLTALVALQGYYTYAKEQLAVAGGHEPGASVALYGMARLQAVLGRSLAAPKAIALHQAALLVDPNNYLAANELAVLMVRHGEPEDARLLLIHSISLSPRSETWHNLAVVCQMLGRNEDARAAHKRYQEVLAAEQARQRTEGTAGGMIYWVDNDRFLQSPDPAGLEGPPAGAKKQSPPASTTGAAEKTSENRWTAALGKGLRDLGLTKRNDGAASNQ